MKRIASMITALAAWSTAHAIEPLKEQLARREAASIERLLADGRCASAVDAVKAGLANKNPRVMLLAGTMFEEGICVKADWNRAAGLYMRAQETGQRFALEHLMAGYARPGRDNGMALYWAAQTDFQRSLPKQCIPAANPLTDADGFAAEVDKMPPATFQSCVYTIGVLAEIQSQARYPRLALEWNVMGTIEMAFSPAAGSVDWTVKDLRFDEDASPHGVRNGAKDLLQNPKAVRNSLLNYMKGKSNYALQRYTRPEQAGIDPAYVYRLQFDFSID